MLLGQARKHGEPCSLMQQGLRRRESDMTPRKTPVSCPEDTAQIASSGAAAVSVVIIRLPSTPMMTRLNLVMQAEPPDIHQLTFSPRLN